MKLSKIKPNPSNPRNIRGERLEALKKSVIDDAWMRSLREIVVDEDMKILGGNMRYQALKAAGIKEIPDNEVKIAKGLSDEQKRRFVILDNASFGDWDFDILANEFDDLPLKDWIDLPNFEAAQDVQFKEYTEDVENEVQYITCPNCEHKFPK